MPDNSIITVNPNSKGGETRINWHYIEQIVIKYFSNRPKNPIHREIRKRDTRFSRVSTERFYSYTAYGEGDISMKLLMDFSKKGITLILNL